MSTGSEPQTENEGTHAPANTNTNTNTNTDTKLTLRRAPSIAEQIAQGWRALPEEQRQRWKAATNAARAAEPVHRPGPLHLKPRPLPTDQELFVDELLSTEPNHSADIVDNVARFADDSDSSTTLRSLMAGHTIPPPWRIPGAFSDGLENVPRLAPVTSDDKHEYDEEEAKRYCMTFEAEQHFQAFKAHLLANHTPPIVLPSPAMMQEFVKINRMRRRKGVRPMAWWEYRVARRLRTGTNISARFHSWFWL